VATHLDSLETIISIVLMIGMGATLGYLYYRLRKKA